MERRSFLKWLTALVNAVLAAIVAVPAVRYVLDPLRRGRNGAAFVRVAALADVPADRPVRVPVIAERVDSYTRYPPQAIGAVWLLRQDAADGTPSVRALQVICPHLGCGVDFAQDRGRFACPCHTSDFDPTGRRLGGPAPRDMDELACRIVGPDAEGQSWVEVQYEVFRTGIAEKMAAG